MNDLNLQPTCSNLATDSISRQLAIDALLAELEFKADTYEEGLNRYDVEAVLKALPSAEPELADYAELKQWFIRMASYIDVLLMCPDEQKETLMGLISRCAELMPWTERD